MRARLLCSLVTISALGCGSTEAPPVQDPSAAGSPAPSESSSSPSPTPAPGATTPPSTSAAACGSFGGKIHGTSSCMRVARPSATLTPMATRGAQPTVTATCTSTTPVALATSAVHLECVETTTGPGAKHAEITLVIDDDTAHPEMKGKRILLDTHDGFWDFVNAWVGDRTDTTEVTIDYGVLD